ncbi:MAG: FAD-dependent oxidoreductase, partial [Candidatus Poribacteria bacterium]|nr:FAD-dependent oxidoreductase [Candidatus Poribacteria bacterium]
MKFRIGIIGAGVAGITAAYILQRKHDVTLFEKNDYIGGHTRTVVVPDGPDAGTPIDTGFIVLNDQTYPTLNRFLEQLGVSVRFSDMSFSFQCQLSGLQYAGTNSMGLSSLKSVFAQRRNLFKPRFWRFIQDYQRFNKQSIIDLETGRLKQQTLGEYVENQSYSTDFIEHYALPIGAAIWSTPTDKMADFPAETFVQFFKNHGFLSTPQPTRWQTVLGGAHQYIKAFLKGFNGKIVLKAEIDTIRRQGGQITVKMRDQNELNFEHLVVATHADQALALLADSTEEEKQLLGTWQYEKNRAVLHTDQSVMPTNRHAWASWNYKRTVSTDGVEPLSVTYDLTRLQGLSTQNRYFVTLNGQPVNDESVISKVEFTHPVYDFAALDSQSQLSQLNQKPVDSAV